MFSIQSRENIIISYESLLYTSNLGSHPLPVSIKSSGIPLICNKSLEEIRNNGKASCSYFTGKEEFCLI